MTTVIAAAPAFPQRAAQARGSILGYILRSSLAVAGFALMVFAAGY